MLQLSVGREASPGEGAPQHQRYSPERTLLYQLVEEYYPTFDAQWAAEGRVFVYRTKATADTGIE
jgi:hypothetical protein